MCTLENHRVVKHSKRKTEKGQLTNTKDLLGTGEIVFSIRNP